ncbi:cytochrome P450 monooxygenase-like protein, partial [Dinothrombium tinctorium]
MTFVTLIVILLTFILLRYYFKFYVKLSNLPHKKGSFILGNLEKFTGKLFEKSTRPLYATVFEAINRMSQSYREEGIFVIWLTWIPFVMITNAKIVEAILSSNEILEKANAYQMFFPWLRTGLLTSGGKKWKTRRKMLTPTFHFQILNDFIPIMNHHANVLIEKLRKTNGESVNIVNYIPLATLDTISETAMGVSIDAQQCPNSQYINSVFDASEKIQNRFFSILHKLDFIYFRSQSGKQFMKSVEFMRNFTLNVINKKKEQMLREKKDDKKSNDDESSDVIFFGSRKKKMAFIELLLKHHLDTLKADGSSELEIEDIREEVDTFMFEGFDTTSTSILFTLFLL